MRDDHSTLSPIHPFTLSLLRAHFDEGGLSLADEELGADSFAVDVAHKNVVAGRNVAHGAVFAPDGIGADVLVVPVSLDHAPPNGLAVLETGQREPGAGPGKAVGCEQANGDGGVFLVLSHTSRTAATAMEEWRARFALREWQRLPHSNGIELLWLEPR